MYRAKDFLNIIAAIMLIGCVAFGVFSYTELTETRSALQASIAEVEELTEQNAQLAAQVEELTERAEAAEAEKPAYYAPQSYYDSDYDDMTDQEYIAWRESGWDYDARNGRYIGKYQMDESRLDGDWSPENQERVAEQYMLDRYGSWENARAFWDANGWW